MAYHLQGRYYRSIFYCNMTGGNGSKIQPTSRVWFVINDRSGGSGGQPQTARKKKKRIKARGGRPAVKQFPGGSVRRVACRDEVFTKKVRKEKTSQLYQSTKGAICFLVKRPTDFPPPFFIHELRLNVFLCPC